VQEKYRKNAKKALGLVGVALLAGLLGFGCKNSVSGTPGPKGVMTLAADSNAQNIPKGENLQFTAEFTDDAGVTDDEPGSFTWEVVSAFDAIPKHDDTIIENGLLMVSPLETSPRLKVEAALKEAPIYSIENKSALL
jgi:ABC-type branched-subunit amino acid transport system substrate-binding protein